MNKLILFFTIIALSFGCTSSDSSNSNNNNGNSFTNSMDYEFIITINGEVHKISGNSTNGLPVFISSSHTINNLCEASLGNVICELNDITESNYVSGQVIKTGFGFPNLMLGVNQATNVIFTGEYVQNLATSLGASQYGFQTFQTSAGPLNSIIANKLPITITDLGTTTILYQDYPLPDCNFGQTLKGHYSGTIYLLRNSQSGLVCDVPVQLSIDFKALRTY
jgi:hypothetical protein